MEPQTLAYQYRVSDVYLASSDAPDVVAAVTEVAHRAVAAKMEEFIIEHGPCIVSRVYMHEVPSYDDPLTQGRTMVWKQYVMPIHGATDRDWQMMRARCDLES